MAYLWLSVPSLVNLDHVISNVSTMMKSTYPKSNIEIDYWDRSSYYDPNSIIDSSGLILYVPRNGFSWRISDMPFGVRRELKEAKELGIPIFIIYQRLMDNKIFLYTTIFKSNGALISGSTRVSDLSSVIKITNNIIEDISSIPYTEDRSSITDVDDIDNLLLMLN